MIRAVIAPDSFTHWRSSSEVAAEMATEARAAFEARGVGASIRVVPMADGGKGTATVLRDALGGRSVPCRAKDPLGEPRQASYVVLPGGAACIELAEASGIELLTGPPDRRHPFLASTFGTGELILHAYGHGSREIVVAVGGSGTNDGGIGLAQALGVELLDGRGLPWDERRREGWGAAAILPGEGAASIRFSRMLDLGEATVTVACDVDAPLLGSLGASAIFGPQKGATPEMVPLLDEALSRWEGLVARHLEDEKPDRMRALQPPSGRLADIPRSGAAGGAAFALCTLFGATLTSGAPLVARMVGLEAALADADIVLTGEGRIDRQSFMGKVVGYILEAAPPRARCVAIGGSVRDDGIPTLSGRARIVDASRGGAVDRGAIASDGSPRLRLAVREAVNWALDFPPSPI